jgi:hypothetical protein
MILKETYNSKVSVCKNKNTHQKYAVKKTKKLSSGLHSNGIRYSVVSE